MMIKIFSLNVTKFYNSSILRILRLFRVAGGLGGKIIDLINLSFLLNDHFGLIFTLNGGPLKKYEN